MTSSASLALDACCVLYYAFAWIAHSLIVSAVSHDATTASRAAMLLTVEFAKLTLVLGAIGIRTVYLSFQAPRGPQYTPVSAAGASNADPESGESIPESPAAAAAPRWWAVAQFAFPATVYAIVNLLGFAALGYVDPATYKVLLNVRVLTTGLLSAILLRHRLSPKQWVALVLLAASCAAAAPASVFAGDAASATAFGALLVLAQAGLSSLGSVVYQLLAQTGGDLGVDRLQANALLYACGVPVQLLIFVGARLFHGQGIDFTDFAFSQASLAVIAMYVCAGLGTAVVLTRIHAIGKEFAHSLEMIITPFAQWAILSMDPPSPRILLTIAGAAAALALFNRAAVAPPVAPESGADDKTSSEKEPLQRADKSPQDECHSPQVCVSSENPSSGGSSPRSVDFADTSKV